MNIRSAREHDASDAAVLLGQLGYPTTMNDARTRILYMSTPHNALLVADDKTLVVGLINH